MTREEAKNILGQVVVWYYDKLHGYPKLEYIAEAAEIILSEPSIPINLDEAAEEILSEKYPQLHNGSFLTEREMVKLIKAGAEWMAGQGETIDGEVVKDINNNLAITAKGFSGKEAVFGDKVIVQIRKK